LAVSESACPRRSDVRLSVVVGSGVRPATLRGLASNLEEAFGSGCEMVGVGSALDVAGVDPRLVGGRLSSELDSAERLTSAAHVCRGDYVWFLDHTLGIWPEGLYGLARAMGEQQADIIGFDSRLGVAGASPYGSRAEDRSRVGWFDSTETLARFVCFSGLINGPANGSGILIRRSLLQDLLEDAAPIPLSLALLLKEPEPSFHYVQAVVTTEQPTLHPVNQQTWPFAWARALKALEASRPYVYQRVRGVVDQWSGGRRVRWPILFAAQLLEILGESDWSYTTVDVERAVDAIARLLPEKLTLHHLLAEMAAAHSRLSDPMVHVATVKRAQYGPRDVATVDRLRGEAIGWREALHRTPWYSDFYITTWQGYDVYNFGEGWLAARVDYRGLDAALKVGAPTSAPPYVLTAENESELRQTIHAQPAPSLWLASPPPFGGAQDVAPVSPQTRSDAAPVVHIAPQVAAPAVHVHVAPSPPLPPAGPDTIAKLKEEITRQDLEVAAIYASSSWRWSAPLRALARLARRPTLSPTPVTGPAPILYNDRLIELSNEECLAYLARGFSTLEDWGRWTDGSTAIIRARHEVRRGDASFELWPQHVWRRAGVASRVELSVNGGDPRLLGLEPERPLSIALPASSLRPTGELDLRFIISDPKRPDEAPVSERRRLGFGLAAFRLTWS
jgi:hypothetical protein